MRCRREGSKKKGEPSLKKRTPASPDEKRLYAKITAQIPLKMSGNFPEMWSWAAAHTG
jgi:hypothetical protein